MNWRTAIEGARRWLNCEATTPEAAAAHADHCRACDSLHIYRLPVLGHCYGTCGPALEETEDTCGCLVLAADGAAVAAAGEGDREAVRAEFRRVAEPTGKTGCIGERCPRGKW